MYAYSQLKWNVSNKLLWLTAHPWALRVILTVLPFVLAFVIHLVNPGFLNVLFTDPAGPMLIGGALMMMVSGIYVMSRIIKIRV